MDDISLTGMVEVRVVKVSPYQRSERPLLWLCEKGKPCPRLLPIAIGQFEAAAIQMHLNREDPPRPISYDLLTSILEQLVIPVRYAVIHTVHKQIYYATVTIEKSGQLREIDSRPSDAVALALRTQAPIYVSRELLELAGLPSPEDEVGIEHTIAQFCEIESQVLESESSLTSAVAKSRGKPLSSIKSEKAERIPPQETSQEDLLGQLKAKLEQAVICEEYEEAARLRDKIEILLNQTNP